VLLTIDSSGLVTEVTLDQPHSEAVDAAIVAAARALRFEPAQRAGQAIGARVRVRFDVAPPAPVDPEPTATGTTQASPSLQFPDNLTTI